MIFKIAKENDSAKIAILVNSAYRGESSRQGWTTEADLLGGQRTDPDAILEILQTPDNVFLLCFLDDVLMGSVHLRREHKNCYLGMFAIKPDSQAQGLGKAFLLHVETFARAEWRCETMTMTVIALRTELIQWYGRRGYVNTGEWADFPYGDERFGIPYCDDLKLCVLQKVFTA
jgi:ribosomal protein S18 acetylase RimI-like enzyme